MGNFSNFLKANGLKKKDIASFLGVSNAFITQLCSDARKLPDEKLALIKANTLNWDISMLEQPEEKGLRDKAAEATKAFNDIVGYVRRIKEELAEVKAERDALLQEVTLLKHQLAKKGDAKNVGSSSAAHVG